MIKVDDIFDVGKYRQYLSEFSKYNSDISTSLERKLKIDKYSDEYLQKIIDDTRELVIYLIDKISQNNCPNRNLVHTTIELHEGYRYINNGCGGGWHADILYLPLDFGNDFWVSIYLLRKFLKEFKIEIIKDDLEYFDEVEQSGSIYPYTKLYICGQIESYEEIRNTLKEQKSRELVKVLKLIQK